MVIIDGPIGVGKTTLGRTLWETFHIPLHCELTKPDTMTILDWFYRDKKRWSFTSQVHFLINRFQMTKTIALQRRGLLDRSLFGDCIFAEVLYEEGAMSQTEYNTYLALLDQLLDLIDRPYLLIYLDCSVETAMDRIQMRNRSCEKDISKDYLVHLHKKYRDWYESYNHSNKIILNTGDFNIHNTEDRATLMEQLKPYFDEYEKYCSKPALIHSKEKITAA